MAPSSLVWRLSLVGMAGGLLVMVGMLVYTSRVVSYLGNDPTACANCHVMRDELNGWLAGSHKDVATCNDCHTPHDFVGHYLAKATNGVRHATFFTLDMVPNPIQATGHTKDVVRDNCLRCHGEMTSLISHEGEADETDCLRCHDRVGHQ